MYRRVPDYSLPLYVNADEYIESTLGCPFVVVIAVVSMVSALASVGGAVYDLVEGGKLNKEATKFQEEMTIQKLDLEKQLQSAQIELDKEMAQLKKEEFQADTEEIKFGIEEARREAELAKEAFITTKKIAEEQALEQQKQAEIQKVKAISEKAAIQEGQVSNKISTTWFLPAAAICGIWFLFSKGHNKGIKK